MTNSKKTYEYWTVDLGGPVINCLEKQKTLYKVLRFRYPTYVRAIARARCYVVNHTQSQ